jgi:hypothetical protein
VLVVSEVALSLVLLAGAGLLMRSFFLQREVDLGIRTENVLTTGINLPPAKYKTAEQQARFLHDLLPRLGRLPGVFSVAGSLAFPPFGGINTDLDIVGKSHSETWKGQMVLCSPGYLETVRARLLRGRFLDDHDVDSLRKVGVVNEDTRREVASRTESRPN